MTGKVWVAALLAGLTAACAVEDGGWTPVLEGTPPTFLEEELGRALAEVEASRAALETSPGEAGAGLEAASRRLEGLVEVYLPLYRAKVAAANAYRHLELGSPGEAGRRIDEVEERVLAVSRATQGDLEAELEGILEGVADARVALEGASPEAAQHLRRLTESLDNLLTRAGLVL